ncbi:MAG: bifunctional phosphoglucose/phosphomannose isomerase, partial [Actinomycetota bacterium]|nr:bifunctional phosphoglucose/phosphomannose isomerase [Actinomycetota bacterium]
MSTLERLRELDAQHQLEAVLALPDHLRDALWRIESARLEPGEGAGVMICGMGGSAIGGDLAAAA